MFDRMAQVIRETGGWVYSDTVGHPRIDYRSGSIRDSFDFGPVVGVPVQAARQSGIDSTWKWGGLYDLRLRISENHAIVRIPEPLYSASMVDARPTGQKQFDYVDPRNRDYQIEMERIATAHLKRIGAWLQPHFENIPAATETFPVKASVVIPVRSRERTVLDAVESALVQSADFEFNVIVVDNHSTDRTTEILRGIGDSRLIHIVPERRDLGIGGCWNEAIYSRHCGQYAVQLDSDDLYVNDGVLRRIVAELEAGPYAMVIGSYTMVDFSLERDSARPDRPSRVESREWTKQCAPGQWSRRAARIQYLGSAPYRISQRQLWRGLRRRRCASAVTMRSPGSMSPFIFVAVGKAIATAPCLSRLPIDTTCTRTGSELSRFRLECADDPRNRRTVRTAGAGMAAACERR